MINILSTDMSKVSLHQPLLLSKLKAYGFQGKLIQLLNSNLCERYNGVKMGKEVSSYRLVNRGCPQGSALGPLLWSIFQNDLPLCVSTEHFLRYLHALPTIRVHPELDERTLDIVHSLRTFARTFSNIDFFLKILSLKDELVMSEM